MNGVEIEQQVPDLKALLYLCFKFENKTKLIVCNPRLRDAEDKTRWAYDVKATQNGHILFTLYISLMECGWIISDIIQVLSVKDLEAAPK